jgi:hypothetical protein
MKPRILAHRGVWNAPADKNSLAALERAIAGGFGVETDIRDLDGHLVVSHDPPTSSGAAPRVATFLECYASAHGSSWLALNIKADGLAAPLATLLERYAISTAFVFDMSVPDMRGYLAKGVPVFTRRSDAETDPVFYEKCTGVWVDSFAIPHSPAAWGRQALNDGKAIALVSPELHGRPHFSAWAEWRTAFDLVHDERVMICTDFPNEAATFFRGGND